MNSMIENTETRALLKIEQQLALINEKMGKHNKKPYVAFNHLRQTVETKLQAFIDVLTALLIDIETNTDVRYVRKNLNLEKARRLLDELMTVVKSPMVYEL